MKYLDFFSLFDADPADIVFFSTFQFDPDFFERRLLRCGSLQKARRIAIFMDARQWQHLLNRDVHTRWLNRRYLVVPVQRTQGVFHPKLNMVLSKNGGQIQCGSNNLTRSGCSSNLELINAIPFEFNNEYAEAMRLASQTLAFFKRAAQDADDEASRIITSWIADAKRDHEWLSEFEQVEEGANSPLQLIHTYDGPIWDRIVKSLKGYSPNHFFVVSPFYDASGEICKRLAKQWPKATVELLVQQGYTNLPVASLRKLPSFKLSEIFNATGEDASRRVHAKLLAWKSSKGDGCLTGSANFTSAAFDGRNVEACLLMLDTKPGVDQLFDNELTKRPISPDDFEPGTDEPPEAEATDTPSLQIVSAVLIDANHIRVSYKHSLADAPRHLVLDVRMSSETRPRKSLDLPLKRNATETVVLPKNTLADCHGVLMASLTAKYSDEQQIKSLPVWIVQEERLTYEMGDGSSSSQSRIGDTGEGLSEYIEELGKRDGAFAIVEYLRHFNIRFHDGAGRFAGKRRFRVRISDPHHDDSVPDWLINTKREAEEIEQAIYDFVDRHIRKKLRKHAERGNINGMENFLDIFTTLAKVLYRWYRRNIVKRGYLISMFITMLQVATRGKDSEKESFDGYLYSLRDSLEANVDLLQEVCTETNYCGEIRAALLIVQKVRFDPGEVLSGREVKRPKQTLITQAKMVTDAISECNLQQPSSDDVRNALERYRIFSEEEMENLLREL